MIFPTVWRIEKIGLQILGVYDIIQWCGNALFYVCHDEKR